MRKLKFIGTVQANTQEMVIPGRDELVLETGRLDGVLDRRKFLNFLERAGSDREWRAATPSVVVEIKALFKPWQLAEFLNTPRRLGVLGHTTDDEGHRLLRAGWEEAERIREDAKNLMLLEWAKELFLDEEG
jgi:hypothetical protein